MKVKMLDKALFLILFGLHSVVLQATEKESVRVGDVPIAPLYEGKPFLHVIHQGRSIKVQRVQDPDYELKGYFAKTVRQCPPFCIRPIEASPGVKTIGEIELFDFMENELRDGKGLLIDARTESWYEKGTIPGSINYPFSLLSKEPDSAEMRDAFERFRVKRRIAPGFIDSILIGLGLKEEPFVRGDWDFGQAYDLVLWCNGPSCGQSPRAINGLLAAGYPAEKLKYYRGGMQMWQLWGLTTIAE